MDNEKIILDLYKRVVDLEEKLNKALKDIEELKPEKVEVHTSPVLIEHNKKGRKDTTKYLFNGKSFGKSRLVLAVVQAYVTAHLNISFNELTKAFDASLQGPFGVLNSGAILESKYRGNEIELGRRFFTKENESILLNDGTKVYVCTQWGVSNIRKFIANAENHGFVIREI